MADDSLNLHIDILPKSTRQALERLSKRPWLKKSRWYLAGGTALALQTGHRVSYDLDFFTPEADFDNTELLNHLAKYKNWETSVNKKSTVYGLLSKAKVSFIAYPFFVPKQPFLHYGTLDILDARDIAVMKIIAVSQRGRKRDFYDLFWCAHHLDTLESIIKKLPTQYPNLAHNYNHILTSLVYFNDAESDPDPEIKFPAQWQDVKDFFMREVPKISRDILELYPQSK